MKTRIILAGIVIAVLNGLALFSDLRPHANYLLVVAMAVALWLVARALVQREPTATVLAPAPAAPPPPPAVSREAEATAVALLGIFQEKGRLVDFLMDDIAAYSDAQVGAAARVVHQGLKPAFQEHFQVVPVASEAEGSRISVPAEAPPAHYRLSGKLSGEGPFSGTLVHRGWKVESLKLPRSTVAADSLPPIAPAQVEVR